MKKLLLLSVILIVGCEEILEPEDACGVKGGDGTTCADCAGVPNGLSSLDKCGVCDSNLSNDCVPDCTASDGTSGFELWDVCYSIKNTTTLDLGNTGLTGEIPVEIGNLKNLEGLWLSDNQLTGKIPSEIGNLTNLTHLSLYNNQLTGSMPSEIGQLTDLTALYLYNNQLTGEIPQQVCDLFKNLNLHISDILDGNNLTNTCE